LENRHLRGMGGNGSFRKHFPFPVLQFNFPRCRIPRQAQDESCLIQLNDGIGKRITDLKHWVESGTGEFLPGGIFQYEGIIPIRPWGVIRAPIFKDFEGTQRCLTGTGDRAFNQQHLRIVHVFKSLYHIQVPITIQTAVQMGHWFHPPPANACPIDVPHKGIPTAIKGLPAVHPKPVLIRGTGGAIEGIVRRFAFFAAVTICSPIPYVGRFVNDRIQSGTPEREQIRTGGRCGSIFRIRRRIDTVMKPINSSITDTNSTIHISTFVMRLPATACWQLKDDIIHGRVCFKDIFAHIKDERV